MSNSRIKKDDIVKIISGANKGQTGKAVRVDAKNQLVYVDGLGVRKRNIKPNQLNPRGGTKDVHTGIPAGKVALVVDDKTGQTSRVGYNFDKSGKKIRVAKALDNKEIK